MKGAEHGEASSRTSAMDFDYMAYQQSFHSAGISSHPGFFTVTDLLHYFNVE
jgi:hypothetical protein